MKKAWKIIILILFILLVFMISIKALSNEDDWICNEEGEWVKHGHPLAEKPSEPCEERKGFWFFSVKT